MVMTSWTGESGATPTLVKGKCGLASGLLGRQRGSEIAETLACLHLKPIASCASAVTYLVFGKMGTTVPFYGFLRGLISVCVKFRKHLLPSKSVPWRSQVALALHNSICICAGGENPSEETMQLHSFPRHTSETQS